jgi:hypothetical protein
MLLESAAYRPYGPALGEWHEHSLLIDPAMMQELSRSLRCWMCPDAVVERMQEQTKIAE